MPDDLPDDLTNAQTEAVRRLLADARETDPMPHEVATRLDAVVADLAGTTTASVASTGDSPAPGAAATVTALRRRRWPRVVLAAAAVTAIGLGGTQLLMRSGQDDMRADTASEVGDAPTLHRDQAGEGELSDDTAANDDRAAGSSTDEGEERGPESSAGGGTANRAAVTLPGLDQALRAQEVAPVGRLREVDPPDTRMAAKALGDTQHPSTIRGAGGWRCGPLYAVPEGSTYSSLSREGTRVVAHPPANGIRLVEVYECRGPDPRRSTTVVTLTVQE